MENTQANQKPAANPGDEAPQKEHINTHEKKEDDSAVYLEPDEDNTLQTPEEFAKDKGKVLGDEDGQ